MTKWVLLVSDDGFVQYFVGDFDGFFFSSENPSDTVLWLDRGPDFYAAVTYNDVEDGRRILVGWMDNWEYAQATPTEVWRGAMALPRLLWIGEDERGRSVIYQVQCQLFL